MRIHIRKTKTANKKVTFTTDPVVCEKLGEAIYNVATDKAVRASFRKDPEQYLIDHGALASQFAKRKVKVQFDTPDTVSVVIPVVPERSSFKNQRDFEKYLRELGFVTVMGCR